MNLQFKAENGLINTVPSSERYMGAILAFSSLLELNLMTVADTSDIADSG